MPIIRKDMAVICRTPEEVRLFEEIALAEGHKFASGEPIVFSDDLYKIYFVNYKSHYEFPTDISYVHRLNFLEDNPHDKLTVVEASTLFRNHLISRRAKNGCH